LLKRLWAVINLEIKNRDEVLIFHGKNSVSAREHYFSTIDFYFKETLTNLKSNNNNQQEIQLIIGQLFDLSLTKCKNLALEIEKESIKLKRFLLVFLVDRKLLNYLLAQLQQKFRHQLN
jgi:hypothetical protein